MSRVAPHVAEWQRRNRGWPGATQSVGEAPVVTFPTTPLGQRIYIALGADLTADPSTWAWENITSYVRWDHGVQLRTGRRDRDSTVQTGTASMKLDNRDGRFTRRNPLSPYYGLLTLNTPIWAEVDAGSGFRTRLEMFVNEWPGRWTDKSANDATVTIQCTGVIEQLLHSKGGPLKSALRQTYDAAAPLAYWPLEDEGPTTRAASGLLGGSPIRSSVPMEFVSGQPGTARALSLLSDTAGFFARGDVAMPTLDAFQAEWVALSDQGSTTDILHIAAYADDTGVNFAVSAALADGLPHHFAARFTQNGADVDVDFYKDGVLSSTTTSLAVTISDEVTFLPPFGGFSTGTVTISHIAVFSAAQITDPSLRTPAADGHTGEQAHERIERLCTENGVAYQSLAVTSARMGPQSTDTLINVLRECARAGQGVLYEKRWGLAYQSLAERYNQSVAFTLDFALGQISEEPEPADDRQSLVNKWTVTRPDGSSAVAELTTGPMGTGQPVGPGIFPGTASSNLESDEHLDNDANWRLHLTTIDKDQWPRVDFKLNAHPELFDPFTTLGYGARMEILNPLSQMPPDTIDAIIEGQTEKWTSLTYDVQINTSPASPYGVGVYGESVIVSKYDTAGSETTADFLSGTDTSMTVATTLGPVWIQDAAHFPFNIRVSGVVLEVTAISGASSPQTFTITQAPVNGVVKTILAGESVSLDKPAYYGL